MSSTDARFAFFARLQLWPAMPVAKEEQTVESALAQALSVADNAREAEDRSAWLALKAQWLAAETAGAEAQH